MEFVSIDYIFGEAEPVGPPGVTVSRYRADEKVTDSALYDIVAEFDVKLVYRYLDDKLTLLVRILHRPRSRLINTFAAHLHGDNGRPARLEFCPADTDYGGGDFAIRLEDEFPVSFFGLPRADEKIRELLDTVDGNFYAVAGRVLAAGIDHSEKYIKHEHESFHNLNFRRMRNVLQ